MRRALALLVSLLVAAGVAAACDRASDPLRIGAIYPLSGSQGPGGVEEYRGVRLAAELVNDAGGVHGRTIELVPVDVAGSDAAAAAVAQLDDAGVRLILGSYGSTISAAAAEATNARGLLLWETGAVGTLPMAAGRGELTFRVPPSGPSLGHAAIEFVAGRLADRLGVRAGRLRFATTFVDDVYGRSVAAGASRAIRELGLTSVGSFGYAPDELDAGALVRRVAARRPDVVFVSAYLEDGVAIRRELVRQHVRLVANIGTSSSFCMPEFGAALGPEAVGVFASDKPAADVLDTSALRPEARELLTRANEAYRSRWGTDMEAPALAGFSAAWALLHDVLSSATTASPPEVAAAAQAVRLPVGSLPNGSGLRFGEPGSPTAGDNLAAVSVVWEWVGEREAVVVWPDAFATQDVERVGALA